VRYTSNLKTRESEPDFPISEKPGERGEFLDNWRNTCSELLDIEDEHSKRKKKF